jgi:hypothetical protein
MQTSGRGNTLPGNWVKKWRLPCCIGKWMLCFLFRFTGPAGGPEGTTRQRLYPRFSQAVSEQSCERISCTARSIPDPRRLFRSGKRELMSWGHSGCIGTGSGTPPDIHISFWLTMCSRQVRRCIPATLPCAPSPPPESPSPPSPPSKARPPDLHHLPCHLRHRCHRRHRFPL